MYLPNTASYGDDGKYTITTSYSQADLPNDLEPNDNFANAQTFNLNSTTTAHQGYFGNGSKDEEDWFQLFLPSDGYLSVNTSLSGYCGNHPILTLYGSDGTTAIDGPVEFLVDGNLTTGTYYVKAEQFVGSYSIINSFTPTITLHELIIAPTYHTADIGEPVTFSVKAKDISGADYVLKDTPIFSVDNPNATIDQYSGTFVATKAGTYTVTVKAEGKQASATVEVLDLVVENPDVNSDGIVDIFDIVLTAKGKPAFITEVIRQFGK